MKTEEKLVCPPAPRDTHRDTHRDTNRDIPRVRIAVLGNVSVGKSALTVRYLTRRFIGEYRSNTDLLYRQTVTVNSLPLEVEIVDVSGETRDSLPALEAAQVADGFLVVYSITDRSSFQYAQRALGQLMAMQALPVALLANKADLEHLRTVGEDEGRTLAEQAGSPFYEVSVAENSTAIYRAFEALVSECRSTQANTGKTRKFSVTKMLTTLMGSKAAALGSLGSCAPLQPSQGTVVVCRKADLYRSSVLKRGHKHAITASL